MFSIFLSLLLLLLLLLIFGTLWQGKLGRAHSGNTRTVRAIWWRRCLHQHQIFGAHLPEYRAVNLLAVRPCGCVKYISLLWQMGRSCFLLPAEFCCDVSTLCRLRFNSIVKQLPLVSLWLWRGLRCGLWVGDGDSQQPSPSGKGKHYLL